MSGHSKWSQIKRQKGANDLKKGQIYTKISKQIVLAVKQAGGDPNTNFSLKMAVNKAKSMNMPSDNIDKAIKKALGEGKTNTLESTTYEAYGAGGATILIDALTDNRNRAAADIRLLIEKNGGRMVEAGGISWQYENFGLITMLSENEDEKKNRENKKWNDKDEIPKLPTEKDIIDDFEIKLIDIEGVMDVNVDNEDGIYILSIYTQPDKLDLVRKAIDALGYAIEQADIIKKTRDEISLDENNLERNRKLIDVLEDNDDVDNIWTNVSNI